MAAWSKKSKFWTGKASERCLLHRSRTPTWPQVRKSAAAHVWTQAASKNGLKTAILACFWPRIAAFGVWRDGKGAKIGICGKKSNFDEHYGLKDPCDCSNAPGAAAEVMRCTLPKIPKLVPEIDP